jgi:hypothetical protein
LESIDSRTLTTWYKQWTEGGKLAVGRAFIGQLRALFSHGCFLLEDSESQRLYDVLDRKRFKPIQRRKISMTSGHARAIRAKARSVGMYSVALAQAFQYELMMRQKDVIGDWVPKAEAKQKVRLVSHSWVWTDGLLWEEIDDQFILRHPTTARERKIEVDLKRAPMVFMELSRYAKFLTEKPLSDIRRSDLPAFGPLILCEMTARPWEGKLFRRKWRKLADMAGVPRAVKNMDSRAGAKMVRIVGRDFRDFERPRPGQLSGM